VEEQEFDQAAHIERLEVETRTQQDQIDALSDRLNKTLSDNEQLVKLSGQISIIRWVFCGVLLLLFCTLMLSSASWFITTHNESVKQTVASTLSLAERVLLVLIGVLSSLASGLYGQRNNSPNNGA